MAYAFGGHMQRRFSFCVRNAILRFVQCLVVCIYDFRPNQGLLRSFFQDSQSYFLLGYHIDKYQ